MPKIINKDHLRNIILSQKDTFTPDDITKRAIDLHVSRATVYSFIKDMIAEGTVIMDRKDGHRMYYGVASASGSSVSSDISQNCKSIQISRVNELMALPVEERFAYVARVVDMVIKGISPSALVTGVAGIGKTYLVKERLEKAGMKKGEDYHFVQGHSSPMGLYRFLYEHRDGIVVFDDCDSVFQDETACNILKSALDSYDVRTVNWQAERMPEDLERSFDFEGQIIFISNWDSCRINEAIKSRTMLIDLQMSRKEIIDYMRAIYKTILPEINVKQKEEVIEYLDEIRDKFQQFNLRTLIKVARIRAGASKKDDWRKMALVVE